MNTHQKSIIAMYLCAKDDNKPELMEKVFSQDASLEMLLNTDQISFPSETQGRQAITEVLVNNFNKNYENIFTFCIGERLNNKNYSLSYRWLVAMNEIESGAIRIGVGKYDWNFDDKPKGLANHLRITIDQMLVLEANLSALIIPWLVSLPKPWCSKDKVLKDMPNTLDLKALLNHIPSIAQT